VNGTYQEEQVNRKQAVIIGGGPAGLTAALELARRSEILPILFESSPYVGGLSCTLTHHGNRFDIGPHRFFSKSDRVMRWWFSLLPLADDEKAQTEGVPEKGRSHTERSTWPEQGAIQDPAERVMLVVQRMTRILYRRKFFDYPLSLTYGTLRRLGPLTLLRIGLSFLRASVRPIKPETSLEDFLVNRFGRELYRTFFKDYTEKVWGVPCSRIQPDWGAQRIKGLSISKAVADALKRSLSSKRPSVEQQNTETSLIQSFLYPKQGAGQMWEEAAASVKSLGGEIHLNHRVVGVEVAEGRVTGVQVRDEATGRVRTISADYVISSMPVKELVHCFKNAAPQKVTEVAKQLLYRDLITVVIELRRFSPRHGYLPDNWIYVQEPDVKVGRIQIHNNWSPSLLRDPSTVMIGMEYFCQDGDAVWSMRDEELRDLASRELDSLMLADPADVLDAVVVRSPNAYPAYFGGYERFSVIREYVDRFENLFLVGRNGMHKYNNMDHSMLTAMSAVDNMLAGITAKDGIWDVNTESDYHEVKQGGRVSGQEILPEGKRAGPEARDERSHVGEGIDTCPQY
jgi:protoporphyrinogen oxidase